jgi:acetyl esterase/lipase
MSIFLSCQRNEKLTSVETFLPAQSHLNISYGKDSLQIMDIHLPAGRNPDSTKSIVLIHGGGWNGGSKNDFVPYIDTLKKRLPNYALFNLNYRLVNGGHLFPSQENDIKAAMDFISNNSSQYHINEDNLVLLGASAGAHLALLQAYKYNSPKVKAVIDFFGPVDLVTMYNDPWHQLVPYALQMITGGTPETNNSIYHNSSPVNFISSQSAPTLIFHGGNDHVVDISQSRLLKNKLSNAGIKHELVVYPRERHGWYGNSLTNSFDRIEEFLFENVR